MFLFHLLGSLVGFVINLILLPFRFIGLPIALLFLPFRMILRFIARHTVLAILLILGFFLVLHFSHKSKEDNLPELTPAKSYSGQKGVPLVEPVLKKEDGDSNFATDLYALMNEQERIQYSQNFYYAMNSVADGQIHNWAHFNINGSIRPNTTFENNSGVRCRTFSEGLKVHTIQQTITGIACRQPDATWCKLKPNATPSCGLSTETGFFSGISRSLGKLF